MNTHVITPMCRSGDSRTFYLSRQSAIVASLAFCRGPPIAMRQFPHDTSGVVGGKHK